MRLGSVRNSGTPLGMWKSPADCVVSGRNPLELHQTRALTWGGARFSFHLVDGRKGWLLQCCQSEVGWVIRSRGNPSGDRTRKNQQALRGVAGVRNCESSDCIRGCDGACSRAVGSLAGVGGWGITNVAALPISTHDSLRLESLHSSIPAIESAFERDRPLSPPDGPNR
jgi:hypothetical protein